MTVAILKCRPITCDSINDKDGNFKLSEACTVNEQLAFYCSWSLLIGFIQAADKNAEGRKFVLPPTNHNDNFVNTFTRALFAANVQKVSFLKDGKVENGYVCARCLKSDKVERV